MSIITIDQVEQLVVEATSFCNLHCPQCSRFNEDGFLFPPMDLEHLNINNFLNSVKPGIFPNLKTIKFEGEHGDVMMHPMAKELFEYCSTFASVLVVTNGSMRSPAWWSKLAEIKNLKIVFSIDGLHDTNHLYRINSNFDTIIKNAKSFIDNGGSADWKFIVFKHNQHQIDLAEKLSKQLGFKNFSINMSSRNFWGNKTVWPVKVDGKAMSHSIEISDLTTHSSNNNKTHINSKKLLDSVEYTPPQCKWAVNKQIYLNFKGHLLPCCMTSSTTWTNDMTSKLWMRLVGNIDDIDISKNSIEDIFKSNFYRSSLNDSFGNIKRVHHICVSNCST